MLKLTQQITTTENYNDNTNVYSNSQMKTFYEHNIVSKKKI